MQFKIKLTILIAALFMMPGTVTYYANEVSAQAKTYKIGDRGPAGGWIFYDKGSTRDGWRYLEAAPVNQSAEAEWGCYEKSIPGASGTLIGTGKTNTAAIIENCGKAGIAAKIAVAYRGGGKSDWFLPSKDELDLMYTNLKLHGIGAFGDARYWSSSEADATIAWFQYFGGGGQLRDNKLAYSCVRAIRAF